jgi:hypothetical protein
MNKTYDALNAASAATFNALPSKRLAALNKGTPSFGRKCTL